MYNLKVLLYLFNIILNDANETNNLTKNMFSKLEFKCKLLSANINWLFIVFVTKNKSQNTPSFLDGRGFGLLKDELHRL